MAKKSKNKRKKAGRARPSPQKRRSSRRALHYLFFIFFGIAVFTTLSLTVLFKIEKITVVGCDKYDESELVEATGILVGDNLFRLDATEIEHRLVEKYPYIESARIHRVFPPSIEVQIEQSVPVAALNQGSEFVLITRTGKVLERGLLLLEDEWLLVKGVDASVHEPGDSLGEWTDEARSSDETPEQREIRLERNEAGRERAARETEALKMMGYLFDAIEETGFEGITNLDITNPLNMQIMYENRLLLKLGSEASLADKLLFVKVVVCERLSPLAHGTINAADLALNHLLVYSPASGYNNDGTPVAHIEEGQ